LGRSFVSTLDVVEDDQQVELKDVRSLSASTLNTHDDHIHTPHTSNHKSRAAVAVRQFHFKKEFQDAVLDEERVQLNYESGGQSMVLMAPYTIGWRIPKGLENAESANVNILLVSADDDGNEEQAKVVRVLAANINVRASFHFVFLPRDIPRKKTFRMRVEIFGNGRKFVGHTHRFTTQLPAFVADV
jgi:hypothetical protein